LLLKLNVEVWIGLQWCSLPSEYWPVANRVWRCEHE